MAGVPRMWTAAGEIKDSEAAAYMSGSERDSDDADDDGRKDDGECVVRAGPRQTGGGAAASPARQESVPAVVVFPCKRPCTAPSRGQRRASWSSVSRGSGAGEGTPSPRADGHSPCPVRCYCHSRQGPCRRRLNAGSRSASLQALLPDAAGGRGREIGDCCLDAQARVPAAGYRAVALQKLEEPRV
jgi:hypothetical protein